MPRPLCFFARPRRGAGQPIRRTFCRIPPSQRGLLQTMIFIEFTLSSNSVATSLPQDTAAKQEDHNRGEDQREAQRTGQRKQQTEAEGPCYRRQTGALISAHLPSPFICQ